MTDARKLAALLVAALAVAALAGLPLALLATRDPATQHDALRAAPSWLRGAHAWAASAALVLAALHLARAHLDGKLRSKGLLAALAGLAALGLLLVVVFTGTILPWDQGAWEAWSHAAQLAGPAPLDPGSAPLALVFWLHVLALPVLLAGAAVLHARAHRSTRRAQRSRDVRDVPQDNDELPWWRLLDWRVALAGVALLLALGAAFPPAIGPPPLPGLEITKPAWPFLWLVPLEDLWGTRAVIALPLVFLVAALLLLRRKEPTRARRVAALTIVVVAWAALTLKGAL